MKKECETMILDPGDKHRWRRGNEDTWVLEVPDAGGEVRW